MSFATVFLDDHDTYSDINGSTIKIFSNELKQSDNLENEDSESEINITELMDELIKVKDLLPDHIQNLVEPYSNVNN